MGLRYVSVSYRISDGRYPSSSDKTRHFTEAKIFHVEALSCGYQRSEQDRARTVSGSATPIGWCSPPLRDKRSVTAILMS